MQILGTGPVCSSSLTCCPLDSPPGPSGPPSSCGAGSFYLSPSCTPHTRVGVAGAWPCAHLFLSVSAPSVPSESGVLFLHLELLSPLRWVEALSRRPPHGLAALPLNLCLRSARMAQAVFFCRVHFFQWHYGMAGDLFGLLLR